MSHDALIADLCQKSDAKIKQFRADAEQRVEKFRKEKQDEYEQQQTEVLSQQANEAEKVTAPILHEAHHKALVIEDEAMGRLAKKFYTLAVEMLVKARENDYEATFAGLVKEVPEVAWEIIRVNPGDIEFAEKYFPSCTIEADPKIIGGFFASADDGKYQVVNTLQSRLEMGWQTILPMLLLDVIKEKDATSTV